MTEEFLSSLEKDEMLRQIFITILGQRRIRLINLVRSLEDVATRPLIEEKTLDLQKRGLIRVQEAPGDVKDLQWYLVTADGLSYEKKLREIQKTHYV